MTQPALSVLTRLARELQRTRRLQDLLATIAERAAEIVKTPRVSIRLLDPDGTRLMAVCRAGTPLHLDPNEPFRSGEGLIGWIVEHGEAIRTGEAEADHRFVERPGMKGPLRSFLGVPLMAGETTVGVLSASNPQPDFFTAEHEEVFTLLACIAAPHVEIARRDFVVRDPLTGLFNHAHLQQRLDREIDRSAVSGLPFSLVLIDVDDFREINDLCGHAAGDRLLVALADLLRGGEAAGGVRLRGQDFVARFAPDQMALVLPHTPKPGGETKGDKLREHIAAHPFAIGPPGAPRPVTVSVGVAAVPDDATDRPGLVAAAEHALRAAKRRGKNSTVSYSRSLAVASAHESAMAIDIDKLIAVDATIEAARVSFAYQPIVDTASGEAIAYEALCRPADPGFAGPADLFETAEYAGRVVELGRVCRTVSIPPVERLPASRALFINLHPRELDGSLLREPAVARWSRRLVLEITETAAIEDYDRAREVIAALRQQGCRIALDDLGAGYSGLSSLAQLQPDFVKLDMGLIRRIHDKASTRRLVKHILEYCLAEDIPVISEGVETEAEYDMVKELGCPLMQGNYCAPPGPAFPTVVARARSPE